MIDDDIIDAEVVDSAEEESAEHAPMGPAEPATGQDRPKPANALAERMRDLTVQGNAVVYRNVADMSALAHLIATGKQAIPKAFRGEPGMCLAVLMQAQQWNMHPYSLIQGAFVVSDKVAYEAKVIAAVVMKNAPIVDLPEYEYDGEGDKRTCTVKFFLSADRVRTYTTPPFGKITPKNSPLWKTDPDQQLGYYAIRAGARRYFPDILLGAYDYDEVQSIRQANEPVMSGIADRLGGQTGGFNPTHVEDALVSAEDGDG